MFGEMRRTKLDGRFYCRLFADAGRVSTACLRYFNVFGLRQDPNSQYAAAVPIFIDRAIRNEPITINGDGEQTRDFIYVKAVVAANVFFATRSPATGVFNVAGGRRITVNDLAQAICRLTGSRGGKLRHRLIIMQAPTHILAGVIIQKSFGGIKKQISANRRNSRKSSGPKLSSMV